MLDAFICDAVRTPVGRYGGALAQVRADDLAALPLVALMARNPQVDWSAVDDLIYGCANQAGEDNRNVGRMAVLLAGMPIGVPGTTVNRLCGSGMDAVGMAARAMANFGLGRMRLVAPVTSTTRPWGTLPPMSSVSWTEKSTRKLAQQAPQLRQGWVLMG